MPLLRQSLYSQNVNLYLAPTADGRDTWVPLMRTIASEGRCVVLSANQCLRESDLPSWITGGAKEESTTVVDTTHHNGHPRSPPRFRRKSTITDDGNEIVLPDLPEGDDSMAVDGTSTPDRHQHSPLKLLRRKSTTTVTTDGHEIVFPDMSRTDSNVEHSRTHSKPSPSSEFISRGGSCIISPMGDVLAGPLWDDADGLLTVDVDFDDCLRGRLDIDVGGSYSR